MSLHSFCNRLLNTKQNNKFSVKLSETAQLFVLYDHEEYELLTATSISSKSMVKIGGENRGNRWVRSHYKHKSASMTIVNVLIIDMIHI